MVDQKAHKEIEEECNRLKKEIEGLKQSMPQQKERYADYLYSPTSTVATRERKFDEQPVYHQPYSAILKPPVKFDDFNDTRGKIEAFSSTKYDPAPTYLQRSYQETVTTPTATLKRDYVFENNPKPFQYERDRPLIDPLTKYPLDDRLKSPYS